MPFPFEVPFAEIETNFDAFVDEVFTALQSDFVTLPKGKGFIEYPVFEQGSRRSNRARGASAVSPPILSSKPYVASQSHSSFFGRCSASVPQNGLMLRHSEPVCL
jgi:hypothetical protein